MAHVEAVSCNQAQPQEPTNVGAYPISNKMIMVVWDTLLGGAYKYTVTVNEAGYNSQTKAGEQGWGTQGLNNSLDLLLKQIMHSLFSWDARTIRENFLKQQRRT